MPWTRTVPFVRCVHARLAAAGTDIRSTAPLADARLLSNAALLWFDVAYVTCAAAVSTADRRRSAVGGIRAVDRGAPPRPRLLTPNLPSDIVDVSGQRADGACRIMQGCAKSAAGAERSSGHAASRSAAGLQIHLLALRREETGWRRRGRRRLCGATWKPPAAGAVSAVLAQVARALLLVLAGVLRPRSCGHSRLCGQ